MFIYIHTALLLPTTITISHDLKPAEHIGQMVAKAHQRAMYCEVFSQEMLAHWFEPLFLCPVNG